MKNKRFLLITSISLIVPLVSDWKLGSLNFGDFALLFSLSLLLFELRVEPLKKPFIEKFFIALVLFLLVHILLHTLINDNFNILKSVYYSIKICVYVLFCIYFFDYFSKADRRKMLFKYLLVCFSVTILVGLIINLMLINGSTIPQNTIWTFTRQDLGSYRFRNSHIYRMRSFFSEPAHLGVYINTVFSLYLFKKDEMKKAMFWVIVFTISSLLTFSFSSISATALILLLFLILNRKSIRLSITTKIFLSTGVFVIAYIFRSQIYQTIILRFYYIITGIDTSSMNRLLISWSYITPSNALIGNGLGMTPTIWNNIAFIQSDLGLVALIPFLIIIYKASKINFGLVISFIVICFLKGGYLNSSFWFIISTFSLYGASYTHLETENTVLKQNM